MAQGLLSPQPTASQLPVSEIPYRPAADTAQLGTAEDQQKKGPTQMPTHGIKSATDGCGFRYLSCSVVCYVAEVNWCMNTDG